MVSLYQGGGINYPYMRALSLAFGFTPKYWSFMAFNFTHLRRDCLDLRLSESD